MRSRNAVVGVLAVVVLGCGGGGGASPSQPSSPAPVDDSRGSFSLQGAGYNATNTYTSASGGLIFCRRETPLPNTIWIRLASSPTGDGEPGPHIDIDLCNFAGTSSYSSVHDVGGPRSCNQGATFAVWWHDGPSKVFVSRPASSPCAVSVTQAGGAIEGTFQCHGLTPETGSGPSVDVTAGSFRCNFPG